LNVLEMIIDFLLPKQCAGCDEDGDSICEQCLKEIPIAEQICPECGERSPMGWTHEKCKMPLGMDGLIVIYDYQDELMRKIVKEIKFGFNRELIYKVLEKTEFEEGEKFDCLVPIPLHFYRENWRGFNQAEEISKVVGKKTKIEVTRVLKRTRRTKQQSMIFDRKEREKNVKGAFVVVEGFELKNKKILLVDDIFTSGANMRECTRILKKAGAEIVWGLALGH